METVVLEQMVIPDQLKKEIKDELTREYKHDFNEKEIVKSFYHQHDLFKLEVENKMKDVLHNVRADIHPLYSSLIQVKEENDTRFKKIFNEQSRTFETLFAILEKYKEDLQELKKDRIVIPNDNCDFTIQAIPQEENFRKRLEEQEVKLCEGFNKIEEVQSINLEVLDKIQQAERDIVDNFKTIFDILDQNTHDIQEIKSKEVEQEDCAVEIQHIPSGEELAALQAEFCAYRNQQSENDRYIKSKMLYLENLAARCISTMQKMEQTLSYCTENMSTLNSKIDFLSAKKEKQNVKEDSEIIDCGYGMELFPICEELKERCTKKQFDKEWGIVEKRKTIFSRIKSIFRK